MRTAQGDLRFFQDQVGTLVAILDENENILTTLEHDSFGNRLGESDHRITPYLGFCSGLHDRDTNLVLFGFRDYDPDIGRFITPDPLGYTGGDPGDMYEYCVDDPVNGVDRTGLSKDEVNYEVEAKKLKAKLRKGILEGVKWGAGLNQSWLQRGVRRRVRSTSLLGRTRNRFEDKMASIYNKHFWSDYIPQPTCEEKGLNHDVGDKSNWFKNTYHFGANNCYRTDRGYGPEGRYGGQSCYDDDGKLITGGVAAGTPDKYRPGKWYTRSGRKQIREHIKKEAKEFKRAVSEGRLKEYLDDNPASNGNMCPENVVTTVDEYYKMLNDEEKDGDVYNRAKETARKVVFDASYVFAPPYVKRELEKLGVR